MTEDQRQAEIFRGAIMLMSRGAWLPEERPERIRRALELSSDLMVEFERQLAEKKG